MMVRRSQQNDPKKLRRELVELLQNFEVHLNKNDLRTRVLELVSANHLLRDLGSSLLSGVDPFTARDRILLYLRKHVGIIIHGDELMVIAGISEYARRIRELRVELGWAILSGGTFAEMRESEESDKTLEAGSLSKMKPDEYVLITNDQDLEAAFRWNVANQIRKDKSLSVRDKILLYLRKSVGKIVSGEELRYIAGNKSEWARRTRELRTELGWPVVTKVNGRPDIPVGTYILEEDRQSPLHDRKIKDEVRRAILIRDDYTCQREGCGWNHDFWSPSDPRHLEAHHIRHHARGGDNEAENLIVYCNICHYAVHREEKREDK